jgi:hypothetical protein
MKKFILCGLIIVVSLMTNTITAKEKKIRADKVPQLVQNGFKGMMHDAIIKKWMEDNSVFTVIYKQNQKEFKATFNKDGKWMNTSSIINWEDLPETVKNGLNESQYRNWTVFGLIKIDSNVGPKKYALLVDNANQYLGAGLGEGDGGFTEIYKIYFLSQGKFIGNKIQYNYNLL